jgi:hypothetical protein
LLVVEITCWVIGLIGLASWGAFHFRSVTSTQQSLERFATLKSIALPAGTPDQSLWSPKRVSAWQKALSDPSPAPLAVIRIPKIRHQIPSLLFENRPDRSIAAALALAIVPKRGPC